MLGTHGIVAIIIIALAIFIFVRWTEHNRGRTLLAAGGALGLFRVRDSSMLAVLKTELIERNGITHVAMQGTLRGYGVELVEVLVHRGYTLNRKTIAAFSKPGARLPRFELRPHAVLDDFIEQLSNEFIAVEGVPGFESRYTLKSPERDRMRAWLTPETINALLAAPANSLHIRSSGDTIVIFREESAIPADRLQEFLEQAGSFAAIFFERGCVKTRDSLDATP